MGNWDNKLRAMIGARYVCLSLYDTDVLYTDNYFSTEVNYKCWSQRTEDEEVGASIKTEYKLHSATDWTTYNATPDALNTTIFGRPYVSVSGVSNVYKINAPYWRNPHWYKGRWRWAIDNLVPSTDDTTSSYDIRVSVLDTDGSTLHTYLLENVQMEKVGSISNNFNRIETDKLKDACKITATYMEDVGMKFTGAEFSTPGIQWDEPSTEGTQGESMTYESVYIGAASRVLVYSCFDVAIHELSHYFGIGYSYVPATNPAIGYFTECMYVDMPVANDVLQHSSVTPTVVSGMNRYYYNDASLNFDEVYRFLEGQDETTNFKLIKWMDHTDLCDRKMLDDFFILRSLVFEHVNIVNTGRES